MDKYTPCSMSGERRTIDIVDDLLEAFVITNFTDDLLYGVCKSKNTSSVARSTPAPPYHSLKMTPIKVKMISCEMTKNAKYRAITARSRRE